MRKPMVHASRAIHRRQYLPICSPTSSEGGARRQRPHRHEEPLSVFGRRIRFDLANGFHC